MPGVNTTKTTQFGTLLHWIAQCPFSLSSGQTGNDFAKQLAQIMQDQLPRILKDENYVITRPEGPPLHCKQARQKGQSPGSPNLREPALDFDEDLLKVILRKLHGKGWTWRIYANHRTICVHITDGFFDNSPLAKAQLNVVDLEYDWESPDELDSGQEFSQNMWATFHSVIKEYAQPVDSETRSLSLKDLLDSVETVHTFCKIRNEKDVIIEKDERGHRDCCGSVQGRVRTKDVDMAAIRRVINKFTVLTCSVIPSRDVKFLAANPMFLSREWPTGYGRGQRVSIGRNNRLYLRVLDSTFGWFDENHYIIKTSVATRQADPEDTLLDTEVFRGVVADDKGKTIIGLLFDAYDPPEDNEGRDLGATTKSAQKWNEYWSYRIAVTLSKLHSIDVVLRFDQLEHALFIDENGDVRLFGFDGQMFTSKGSERGSDLNRDKTDDWLSWCRLVRTMLQSGAANRFLDVGETQIQGSDRLGERGEQAKKKRKLKHS